MEPDSYDLVVIGGGINGAGIARDAAGRGLSVLLCERHDLGAATSSASSKLIHGGLRYLEQFAFRLVHEALAEREILYRIAPHIVRPVHFLLPHAPELRPAWMIRLGLALYDTLGGRWRLPFPPPAAPPGDQAARDLSPRYARAFAYCDCSVDDARLVVLNALSAAAKGAVVLPRTTCVAARREAGGWSVTLSPDGGGRARRVRARALVNAAGPWVSEVLREVVASSRPHAVRLVKGSHIVVPRLFAHDFAYVFQTEDRRVVFAIPFEDEWTLIGTTEVAYAGDPLAAAIAEREIAYLCRAVNRYLKTPLDAGAIVWSFAGVRPLVDDAREDLSEISRDYRLDVDRPTGEAPLLSVFGGKITTYRRLAERALDALQPTLGFTVRSWTGTEPLPGGDIGVGGPSAYARTLVARRSWLPEPLAQRYARTYGTRSEILLDGIRSLEGFGRDFGGGLYEVELRYCLAHEWAISAEDVLWRRTKLGLRLDAVARSAVAAWIERAVVRP